MKYVLSFDLDQAYCKNYLEGQAQIIWNLWAPWSWAPEHGGVGGGVIFLTQQHKAYSMAILHHNCAQNMS